MAGMRNNNGAKNPNWKGGRSHKDHPVRQLHDKNRRWRILKSRHNLTQQAFVEMETKQNGRCAICNGLPGYGKKYLCVDHDHDTGMLRELLCTSCNAALGLFKEDRLTLQTAIEYLERHKKL